MRFSNTNFTILTLILCLHLLVSSPNSFGDDASQIPDRVLVQVDGAVKTGLVTKVQGGFLVSSSSGQVVVPFGHVAAVARDFAQAYQKQKLGMSKPTFEKHIRLAKWCLDYDVVEGCRTELYAALKINPDDEQARKLLVRMEKRRKFLSQKNRKVSDGDMTKQIAISMTADKAPPLPGHDMKSGHLFMTKVQPYLINRCAGCHKINSDRTFTLNRLNRRSSNQRELVEQNIASIFKQIDFSRIQNSPLFLKPLEQTNAHKYVSRHIRRDRMQWDTIRKWANNLDQTKKNQIASNTVGFGQSIVTAGVPKSQKQILQLTNHEEVKTIKSKDLPNQDKKQDPVNKFLNTILDEEKTDPFDPDVFNRRHHGSIRR